MAGEGRARRDLNRVTTAMTQGLSIDGSFIGPPKLSSFYNKQAHAPIFLDNIEHNECQCHE